MECSHCGMINPTVANFCRACGKPSATSGSVVDNALSPHNARAPHNLKAIATPPRKYAIYSHPTLGALSIKIGFSWPAFFFGMFWMLRHKMWARAGAWFLWGTLLGFVAGLVAPPLLPPIGLTMAIIAGIKGNGWQEQRTHALGYIKTGVVPARDARAAIEMASQSAPVPVA